MGSPPSYGYLLDGRTTLSAGLPLPIVDKEVFLVTSMSPLTILIIPEGGAAIAASCLDNRINGSIKALTFLPGKGTRTAFRMNSRQE